MKRRDLERHLLDHGCRPVGADRFTLTIWPATFCSSSPPHPATTSRTAFVTGRCGGEPACLHATIFGSVAQHEANTLSNLRHRDSGVLANRGNPPTPDPQLGSMTLPAVPASVPSGPAWRAPSSCDRAAITAGRPVLDQRPRRELRTRAGSGDRRRAADDRSPPRVARCAPACDAFSRLGAVRPRWSRFRWSENWSRVA